MNTRGKSTGPLAKQLELRLQQFGHNLAFHPDELNHLARNIHIDIADGPQYFDELIIRAFAKVYTQDLGTETKSLHVNTPADWWQHFKQRWYPKWAIIRWPVRLTTKTASYAFNVHAWYPDIELVPNRPVRYIATLDEVQLSSRQSWMDDYMPNSEFN